MKKNLFRIINIAIIITVITMGTTVFADTDYFRPDDISGASSPDVEKVVNLGNQIIGILQAIGVVVSVVVLIILGIKYMLGSVDQKAEYKKSMMPYVIGAALIFGASTVSYIIMYAIQF